MKRVNKKCKKNRGAFTNSSLSSFFIFQLSFIAPSSQSAEHIGGDIDSQD